MANFTALRDRINLLGRAEYHYDCLVTYFAQHYLDLKEAGYEPLPDRDVFQKWLRHLNRDIRPNLLQAWKEMAAEFGFQLGDRVILDGTDFYPARVSCYPRENIVRFTGFASKKDGKPGSSSVTAAAKPGAKVEHKPQKLDPALLESVYFEGVSRMHNVKEFLKSELASL
jgi:hypothetical protein